jgi:hypothetical protein
MPALMTRARLLAGPDNLGPQDRDCVRDQWVTIQEAVPQSAAAKKRSGRTPDNEPGEVRQSGARVFLPRK